MSFSPVRFRAALAAAALVLLAACGAPEVAQGVYDPYEAVNREQHEKFKRTDKAFTRPVAVAYGEALPEPVRISVNNFADNLTLPGSVVNNLLQLKIEDAFHNTARFLFNSTVGIAGLFDPAATIGINARDTDFGETLHVWGVPEGAYMEIPIYGPSTQRDTVGILFDIALNPLNFAVPSPERYIGTAARAAARAGDRYRFRNTIDSVLYESTDSYAQTQLLYLQNRRFELGQEQDEGSLDVEIDTEGF